MISRRNILGTAAVTPFSLWWAQEALAQTPRVRASAYSAAGRQALVTYREAVRLMTARPAADLKGWTVWYKIHKFPDNWDSLDPADEASAQALELDSIFGAATQARARAAQLLGACPHGSPDFWSWHRMYLFFFERLCQHLTGKSDFALPYWDYRANSVIPSEFRSPATKAANPLWHQRDATFNRVSQPGRIRLGAADYDFYRQADFFDAQVLIEQTPHGSIHVQVGSGLAFPPPVDHDMSSVGRSARDPLFWLHHCEIDRQWAAWQQNRSVPQDADWLSNAATRPGGYAFYDALTNQVVKATNLDVLSIAPILGDMGYSYDAMPPPLPPPSGLFAATSTQLVARTDSAKVGDDRRDQALLTPNLDLLRADGLFATGIEKVRVTIKRVEVKRGASASIGVYLNLPAGLTGTRAEPYRVGSVSTFGLKPHGGVHAGHDLGRPIRFDATEVVQRLRSEGRLGTALVFSTVPLAGTVGADNLDLKNIEVTVEK